MLRLIILAIVIGAPFATYFSMKIRENIVVAAAVDGERKAGAVKCKADIAAMEAKHNAQVDEAVRDAESAGDAVSDPVDDRELIAICKRSASCRSRGVL